MMGSPAYSTPAQSTPATSKDHGGFRNIEFKGEISPLVVGLKRQITNQLCGRPLYGLDSWVAPQQISWV